MRCVSYLGRDVIAKAEDRHWTLVPYFYPTGKEDLSEDWAFVVAVFVVHSTSPTHYLSGVFARITCKVMNSLPVGRYTRPPKPGVTSEPGVSGLKKSEAARMRPVAASRHLGVSGRFSD